MSLGSVRARNVLLLEAPTSEASATARLANFTTVKLAVRDVNIYRAEMLQLGALFCNLFVKEYRGELDETTALHELSTSAFNNPEFDEAFPGMRLLLESIFSQDVISVRRLAENFTKITKLYQLFAVLDSQAADEEPALLLAPDFDQAVREDAVLRAPDLFPSPEPAGTDGATIHL